MTHFWPFVRLICATVVCIIINSNLLRHLRAEDRAPVTLESVVSAWTERESLARLIDVSAVGTEFRSETTLSVRSLVGFGQPHAKAPITVPDTQFDISLRLTIDDAKMFRMDYKGKDIVPTVNGLPDMHMIDIFNANEGRRTTVYVTNNAGFPSGHISKTNAPVSPRRPEVLPLRIIYRPVDRMIGVFDTSKLMLTKEKGAMEGRACAILSDGEKTVWVDPARGLMPVRYLEIRNGVTRRSIDIKYVADAKHGWLPTSWTNEMLDEQGEMVKSVKMNVAECKIGEPIPCEVFEPQYPLGSWVRDYEKKESYILREDGKRRMVLKSEEGKPYEELLRTNTPELPVTELPVSRRRAFPWIAASGIIFGIAVAILWYLLEKRSRG